MTGIVVRAPGAPRTARGPSATAAAEPPRVYATARAQRAEVRLVDGSRVSLAPESRLTVPAAFDGPRREVTLEGEAYFDVVHDTTRPFAVRAREAVVDDIGTRFAVRAYRSERAVRVVVTHGQVQLRSRSAPAGSGALLDPGMLARIDSAGATAVRTGVDTARYVSWRTGRLDFSGTRLGDVAVELGRWYDVDVRLADPALAERRLTARVDGLALARVLDQLAISLDVRVTRRGRTVTLAPTESSR